MRPECKEGLRRVGCLQSMQWARQLHGLALWPTALHLSLLDRKFGGALTRADTLGVDGAEEDEGGAASAQPPLLVLLEDDAPPGRRLGGGGAMSRSHGRCGGWHGATRPAATPVEPADVLLPQCVVRACALCWPHHLSPFMSPLASMALNIPGEPRREGEPWGAHMSRA